MVKKDDFIARLARIREHKKASLFYEGAALEPHSTDQTVHSASTEPFGLVMNMRLAVGAVIAIGLALYAISPVNEAKVAAAAAQKQAAASQSLFGVPEDTQYALADDEVALAPNDRKKLSPKTADNTSRILSETDRRTLAALQDLRTVQPSGFTVPDNMKPFINADGTLTERAKALLEQAENQ